MRKGRLLVGLLIAVAIIIVFGVTRAYQKASEPVIMQDINEVIFTETVIENQPFYAKFASTILDASLKNGAVLLKDANGQVIHTEKQVIGNRLLAIPDLAVGTYTVVVKTDALKEQMAKEQLLTFTVYEEQEKVTSAKELQRYFEAGRQSKEAQNLNDYVQQDIFSFGVSEEKSTMDSANSGAVTSGHSETNNQVTGIEEGDIVVVDEDYVYTAIDNKIFITQAEPLAVVQTIRLKDQYVTKLMQHNQHLLVFYDSYSYENGIHKQMTRINIYNVENPAKPELIREMGQEGYMVGARVMQDTLYVTTEKYDVLVADEQSDLRPALYDSQSKKRAVDYEEISIFPDVQGESYTVISAMALKNPTKSELVTKAFVGGSGQFYMSEKAIYLAAQHYDILPLAEVNIEAEVMVDRAMIWHQPTTTTVYKYAVNGTKIERVAENTVEGSVLNQFSMDEHNGYFRIATTSGNASLQNANSNNHLTIFDEKLQEVGKLTNLARGEKIYSVRYMGDKAYIVTFKETDPLFVIDVADPQNPNVLGELKIPGFSNYLHPLNDTHLIGIGYDTEVDAKNNIVLTKGMKLSLFDVRDVNAPKEVDMEIIGGRGTYSDVQHNHHALYRDTENHYYGFPLTVYNNNDQYGGTGAMIFKITEQGIEQAASFLQREQDEQYENWDQVARRLVYSGKQLFIIYNNKIELYDRIKLQKRGEVAFPVM